MNKEFTNGEAALILGVSKQTIGNRQRAGKLPFPVMESDIKAWVQREQLVLALMLKRLEMAKVEVAE